MTLLNKGLPRSLEDLYRRVEALEAAAQQPVTITSNDISDATAVGKALLTAEDAAAARTAIDAAEAT